MKLYLALLDMLTYARHQNVIHISRTRGGLSLALYGHTAAFINQGGRWAICAVSAQIKRLNAFGQGRM